MCWEEPNFQVKTQWPKGQHSHGPAVRRPGFGRAGTQHSASRTGHTRQRAGRFFLQHQSERPGSWGGIYMHTFPPTC